MSGIKQRLKSSALRCCGLHRLGSDCLGFRIGGLHRSVNISVDGCHRSVKHQSADACRLLAASPHSICTEADQEKDNPPRVSARLYNVIDRVAVLRIELSLSCGIPTATSPTDDRLKRAGDGHAVRGGSKNENVSAPYVSICHLC